MNNNDNDVIYYLTNIIYKLLKYNMKLILVEIIFQILILSNKWKFQIQMNDIISQLY